MTARSVVRRVVEEVSGEARYWLRRWACAARGHGERAGAEATGGVLVAYCRRCGKVWWSGRGEWR